MREEDLDQTIALTVWGGEEDEALLQKMFTSFQAHYADQAHFQITYQAQSESSCKDALLGNLEEGADVFAFADDQVAALAAAGALEPIEQADQVRTDNLDASVEAASVGDQIYAYPLTADNGYFLYYNKEYFSEEDIKSLNQMVEIAALLAQSEYSQIQRIGGKFWDPVAVFADNMAKGNPSSAPLQDQLDRMVEDVTAR